MLKDFCGDPGQKKKAEPCGILNSFYYPKTDAILNKIDYNIPSKCYKNVPGKTTWK
ncbi:MAG: hypothetical protein ABR974_11405 [Bacteroidales bacterium]|jgi:hypothetical protein